MSNSRFDKVKYYKPLPSRLRDLLEESGESRQTLADLLGLRRQTVNEWTLGNSKPDIDTLIKIADHFNVSNDWLLGMPNASREINADKHQAMKTTGLSEKAIDNLISLKSIDENNTASWFIGSEDFISGIKQLSQAIVVALYSDDDSSVYHLVLDNPSSKSPFASEPPYMFATEVMTVMSKCGFNMLENGFVKSLAHLMKLKKEASNNGFDIINMMEGNDNGNDHGTEE